MTEKLVYGLVQVTNGMGRPAMIIDSDGVQQWFEPGDFRFIDMALPPGLHHLANGEEAP